MSAMGESFSPFPRRPRAAGCILLAMVLMSCLALPEAAENGHEDSEMPSIAGLPVLRPAPRLWIPQDGVRLEALIEPLVRPPTP
jgi:hypothetical protein